MVPVVILAQSVSTLAFLGALGTNSRAVQVLAGILCPLSVLVGVAPIYWAHLVPAGGLVRYGGMVLWTTSHRIPRVLSAVFTVGLLLLLAAEVYYTHLATLHSLAHILVFLPAAVVASNVCCLESARTVVHAAALACIGTVLLHHRHDKRAIAMAWHRVIGVHLLSIAAISVPSVYHPNNQVLRLAHSFAYTLCGASLGGMTLFLYLGGAPWGLHDAWAEPPDPYEALCVYSSLAVGYAGLLTAWRLRKHNNGMPEGNAEDGLPLATLDGAARPVSGDLHASV